MAGCCSQYSPWFTHPDTAWRKTFCSLVSSLLSKYMTSSANRQSLETHSYGSLWKLKGS